MREVTIAYGAMITVEVDGLGEAYDLANRIDEKKLEEIAKGSVRLGYTFIEIDTKKDKVKVIFVVRVENKEDIDRITEYLKSLG